jgi:hypothetical protein
MWPLLPKIDTESINIPKKKLKPSGKLIKQISITALKGSMPHFVKKSVQASDIIRLPDSLKN